MKYNPLLLSPLGLIPMGLQPATAADMPVKAKPPQAMSYTPNWTGFYVGLNLGALGHQSKLSTDPGAGSSLGTFNYCWVANCNFGATPTAVGVLGGLQVGYNFQSGNVVYGVEADLGLSSAKKSSSGTGNSGYSYNADTGVNAFGTARLRLGYAFDRTMIYATGGLAFANVRDTFQQIASNGAPYTWSGTGWRAGWTAGLGLEYMFDPKWSFKAEGLYYDLGTKDHVSVANLFGATENAHITDHMTGWVARVGINYLFH